MLSARRHTLVWILIVVASLIGFASILTTWVDRQMLDADAWKQASEQLIEDAEVREAVSVFLVDELYENVDVAEGLSERLPTNLQALAAPLAGALREPATEAVNRLLDAPRIQRLFVEASSVSQQKLVNVLEDDTGFGITTGDGVVTLDLGELVTELGTQLGLPSSALDRIPADAGEFTVMRSDQLAAAQAGVRSVRVLSAVLLVLVLGLYALALYLAKGARRATLRNIGWAFLLVGLAVLVVRKLGGEYAVNALTTASSEGAGQRVWLIGTSILFQIGWAVVLYGVIAVVGAVLAGPLAPAVAVRRRLAPVLRDRPELAAAAVAAAFLLLVAWGPTHALRTWWGILLLGALLAAGLFAFRRQTLDELEAGFPGDGPDAEDAALANVPPHVADTAVP